MRGLRGFLVWWFIVGMTVVVLSPAATASSAAARQHRTFDAAQLDRGVLQSLNQIRALHSLAPLTLNRELSASAAAHTREMGTRGYFQHSSFDGTAFWKRIEQWYTPGSYGYWSVGENQLWESPDIGVAGAIQLWMGSPEHRANILNPSWRQVGVSAMHFASAPGTYGDQPVTIVTTDFGVRR